jgi:hypothetical protein
MLAPTTAMLASRFRGKASAGKKPMPDLVARWIRAVNLPPRTTGDADAGSRASAGTEPPYSSSFAPQPSEAVDGACSNEEIRAAPRAEAQG